MGDLRKYLAGAGSKPFRYGRHDCCTVAARWVQASTGVDVLRGQRYTNLRDGMKKLAAGGFADHVALFAASLPRTAKLSLMAGDIAVLPADGLPALGIVQPGGESIWCFGPGGVGTVPLTVAEYGFKTA